MPVLELQASIWRGWIVPVGGSTPDRHKVGTIHPRKGRETTDGKQNQLKDLFREDVLPVLELQASIWRGWIVPVGGSTPDRHKALGDGKKCFPFLIVVESRDGESVFFGEFLPA